MTANSRNTWIAIFLIITASLICLPWSADAAETVRSVSAGTLWQWVMQHGGRITMGALAGMSVLMLAFILYFYATLRKRSIVPKPLYRELLETLKKGNVADARRACDYRPCPLSSVAIVAMDYMRNIPEIDVVVLKDVIEGEGSRQAEAIQGPTQYLLDIAVVAPMVGLLGTVFGMLRAFRAVQDIASAKPVLLAEGITLALRTTAFGLMVGIPAMVFYAYFRRKASKQVSNLESASIDVMTALLSEQALTQDDTEQ